MDKKPYLFVTVGSTDFDNLIKAVDELIPNLNYQGIFQIGEGQYIPKNFPYFRFSYSLKAFYEKASLAIAHGGLATTIEILTFGIPLISVSNPDRYDNHQNDLLETMEKLGHLVWCRNLNDLQKYIDLAVKKTFVSYKSPECKIHLVINNFLKDPKI